MRFILRNNYMTHFGLFNPFSSVRTQNLNMNFFGTSMFNAGCTYRSAFVGVSVWGNGFNNTAGLDLFNGSCVGFNNPFVMNANPFGMVANPFTWNANPFAGGFMNTWNSFNWSFGGSFDGFSFGAFGSMYNNCRNSLDLYGSWFSGGMSGNMLCANTFNPVGWLNNNWWNTTAQTGSGNKPSTRTEENVECSHSSEKPEKRAVSTVSESSDIEIDNKAQMNESVSVEEKDEVVGKYGRPNNQCPNINVQKVMEQTNKDVMNAYLKNGKIVGTDIDFKKITADIKKIYITPVFRLEKGRKNDYVNPDGKKVYVQDGTQITIEYEYKNKKYFTQLKTYKVPKNVERKTVIEEN